MHVIGWLEISKMAEFTAQSKELANATPKINSLS